MDMVTYALLKKYVQNSLDGIGALQGQDGKSAYEIAKEQGFSGSEKEWITSLTGDTPYIGSNGNWFIGTVDTGVSTVSIKSYNDLKDKPTLNGNIIEGDMVIESIPLNDIKAMFEEE